MKKKNLFLSRLAAVLFLCFCAVQTVAQEKVSDSTSVRTQFSLPNPIKYDAFYDIRSNTYYLYPKVGNLITGNPVAMSPREYQEYVRANQLSSYYREKSDKNNLVDRREVAADGKKGFIPTVRIKNKLFQTIFGGDKIEIIPQGFASFDLGILYQKIDNPLILPQNRTNFAINIQQRIQLGLLGKVGENLQLKANYDTQSGFAFENKLNLVYQAKGTWQDLQSKGLNDKTTGGEDKIIKRIEFGNVNLPLSTSLIRGSESLFGLKTEFQLGKTTGTLVLSQQQGEARNIVVQGGGVFNTFKINAKNYEDNQHYYLGKYFLNNYDTALLNYPQINSRVNITRIEAWVLDQGSGNLQEQKGLVGIRDLGDGPSGLPDNSQNGLYQAISTAVGTPRDLGTNYVNVLNGQSFPNANGVPESYINGEQYLFNRKSRRLSSGEFTYNPQLGYLSLSQRLNDNQLLAVAYSYTLNGDSRVYKVGEFSEDSPVIIAKLLKSSSRTIPGSPTWEFMMKNIYSLNASQVNADGFIMNVLYRDPKTGGKINYLPTTVINPATKVNPNLLKLFNWDRLNLNNDLQTNGTETGDGIFDFVPGITIDPENGKLIFTKAKPFGAFLQTALGTDDRNFVLNDLYDQQKDVLEDTKYTFEGRYKGSQGTGISLGAINVPQGSVKVTANGVQLIEGQDYTVDYLLGSVNIINESIKQSGQAINISLENQLTFNTQRKRFLGLNLERKFNDHLTVGATVVNYGEQPLTQKVNFGEEAVNNTMAGFNLLYNNQLPFLTRLTDKIPFINTEAPSNLNFLAEGAYLIPGQNKGTEDQSYIDDFEQTTSKISLKEPGSWSLASKPELNQGDPVFAGAGLNDDIRNGFGRGLISWYNIDPRFYGVGGKAPGGINAQALSNHASRRVQTAELFNNRDFVAGEQTFTNTFDVTYFPTERGPYNYNPNTENSQERWGGLMRPISISNFVNSNIEYVEFWLMDPYADGNLLGPAPKMLLQLGNVSEDVLKDGKLQYENGLPTPNVPANVSTTNLGIQPGQNPILYAFSTEGTERTSQDLGYDGLDDLSESEKYNFNSVNPVTNVNDPASDNFLYYLSDQFQGALAASLTDRYRYFKNPQGNSESNSLEVASQTPDAEDANGDYNLDQNENYNQYNVDLSKANLIVGQNNIVDMREVQAKFQNGQIGSNKWYLFRIPVAQYDPIAGTHDISVLNNVRFARMLLKGFDNKSTLRFGTFDLVRSDYRKYTKRISSSSVLSQDEGTASTDPDFNDNFDVGSVNLEENSSGNPPYVLPPGISRQVLSGTAGSQRQNEASLYLKVTNLRNEARGVFKNTQLDMRRYKNLQLFVHAEDLKNVMSSDLDPNAKFFIRFGSDATDNYYEYESSLKYTAQNAISPLDIWPTQNDINLEIQRFVEAKQKRDEVAGTNITQRYTDPTYGDDDKKIYVKGRPSLGNITTVMIGVRNNYTSLQERAAVLPGPKDLVLWVDELRLSGIDNKGGYAGNASLNFNLGDFAVVNANAAFSTIGFGSIVEKPAERSQNDNSAFSINTTVNVDKFLPEKAGLKIPVNYSYTQTIEDPKYNPLDNDIEFANAKNRDELKKVARTYTQQRSIGVVNMRKERVNTTKKAKFYDVENISLTTIYNDDFFRDIYTKRNYRQYLRGYADYNYSFKPFVIRPFNKMISDTAKSYKYLRWIKEINFNPVPTRLSFRAEVDRNYNELQFRNIDALISGIPGNDFDIIKNRNFYFGWQYGLGFNFTKSLKLEINSATRTLNDNVSVNDLNTTSVFRDPLRAGRPVLYNHRVQLNYRLPFEYLPYLDFINAEVGYGFQYNWNARSTVLLNSPDGSLGSIGQNTNNIIATSTVDVPKFFGKFSYFQKINTTVQKRRQEIDSLNNVYTQERLKKNSKFQFKSYKFKNKLNVLKSVAYALTSVKQLDISYNENNGIVLPGLLSAPNGFGYGQTLGGPTYGFLLGSQSDIRRIAIERGWLSRSTFMNDQYAELNSKNLTANLQIMPVNDFRIDFNVLKNYNRNFTQGGFNVDANPSQPGFQLSYGNEFVSYSRTAWTFRTSFTDGNTIYNNLIGNARQISQSYGGPIGADGYAEGRSLANAYVLVPAFQNAVEGKNGSESLGDATKSGFPVPNWRLTYSGLKNIPFVNSQFSKFDILHSYTSTYTATGVQSSIDFFNVRSNGADNRDVFGDFYNPYTFSQVGYVEAFAPLIGADFTMRNNFQFRALYNRDRAFLLGLVNHTLTEDSGTEYVVGFGYILKDLKFKLNFKGKSRDIKSDLNIRGDFALRDSKTRITNILQNDSQVTGGQRLLSFRFAADYNMSQNFNLKFFYDQLMTKYKISTAFPLSTVRAGITATFTFGGTGF